MGHRAVMLGNIKKMPGVGALDVRSKNLFACFMFFLEIFTPLLQSHSSLCSFSKNIKLHSENSINQQQSNFLKFSLPDNKKRKNTRLAPCAEKNQVVIYEDKMMFTEVGCDQEEQPKPTINGTSKYIVNVVISLKN